MKTAVRKCGWLVLAIGALSAWGCARDVQIKLDARDDRGKMPSVEVHLIGVKNAGEYRRWRDLSMTEYWTNVQADDRVFVMKLGEGLANPQVLRKSQPVWGTKWRGAKLLFVLSSYPPSRDLPGDSDVRRLVVPLKWSRWTGNGPIPILITPSGLICDLEYKPWNPFE